MLLLFTNIVKEIVSYDHTGLIIDRIRVCYLFMKNKLIIYDYSMMLFWLNVIERFHCMF